MVKQNGEETGRDHEASEFGGFHEIFGPVGLKRLFHPGERDKEARDSRFEIRSNFEGRIAKKGHCVSRIHPLRRRLSVGERRDEWDFVAMQKQDYGAAKE